jgi:hypothetical protein
MKARTILVLLVVLTSGPLLVLGRRCMSSQKGAHQPPTVRVALFGAVAEVTGVEVPQAVADGRQPAFQVQDPSRLEVTLPDGSAKSLSVKTAIINTRDGTVVDIDLLPLMRSLPFKQAVRELHRCLGEMGITPDARMRRMLRGWPDDAPGLQSGISPHTYRAEMAVADDAVVLVKARPSADGGWFLVVTFATEGAKRRAVYNRRYAPPSTQPATKPPDAGKRPDAAKGS